MSLAGGLRGRVGLELHVQLKTTRKLFSGSLNEFTAPPNTRISPFDAAHPGTLPVLNRECVDLAVRAAIAFASDVQPWCAFDRKHYFYGDLPNGYQITQHRRPIALGGHVVIGDEDEEREPSRVRLTQIQLEQDTARSLHDASPDYTLVDLNRAGMPLIEIVSMPDMETAEEAARFVRKVQKILRATGVSNANMDEGSLRCDVNVSVSRPGSPFGPRCEIKNLNSVRFMTHAIEFEMRRHAALVASGDVIASETRGYDVTTGETFRLRGKESARDYRFMPEPDVPPVSLSFSYVSAVRAALPELPDAALSRLVRSRGLSRADALVLQDLAGGVAYFDEVADAAAPIATPATCLPWVTSELLGRLNERGETLEGTDVRPARLAGVVRAVAGGKVSGRAGKEIVRAMVEGDQRDAEAIAREKGILQVSDEKVLEEWAERLVKENGEKVEQIRGGRDRVFAWFVGQIMAKSKGSANPAIVTSILRKKMGL